MQNYHLVAEFWIDDHHRAVGERRPVYVRIEEKKWPLRRDLTATARVSRSGARPLRRGDSSR